MSCSGGDVGQWVSFAVLSVAAPSGAAGEARELLVTRRAIVKGAGSRMLADRENGLETI